MVVAEVMAVRFDDYYSQMYVLLCLFTTDRIMMFVYVCTSTSPTTSPDNVKNWLQIEMAHKFAWKLCVFASDANFFFVSENLFGIALEKRNFPVDFKNKIFSNKNSFIYFCNFLYLCSANKDR